MIKFYETKKEDLLFVYSVRNNPDVRKNLINSDEIHFGRHVEWWKETYMPDPCKIIYVVETQKIRLGFVNLEIEYNKKVVEVGIKLLPVYCGKGYGTTILTVILGNLMVNYKGYEIILTVFEDNDAAYQAYVKCGFRTTSSKTVSSSNTGVVRNLITMTLDIAAFQKIIDEALNMVERKANIQK